MLANGEGGPQDDVDARRLYGLAAAQGHALAQARLGMMHAQGIGGPPDPVEARRLFGVEESEAMRAAAVAVADAAAAARAAAARAATASARVTAYDGAPVPARGLNS